MNKCLLIIVLWIMLSLSCAENTARRQQDVPQPTPTPGMFPDLNEAEMKRLDERLPKDARDIFEASKTLELVETTDTCGYGGYDPTIKKFEGCDVQRRAFITDSSIKRKLLNSIFSAAATSSSGNACWAGVHGLRAESEGKIVEMLICFECENFQGTSSQSTRSFGGGFSPAPKPLIESLLKQR